MKYLKKYNENLSLIDDKFVKKLEDEIITNFPFVTDIIDVVCKIYDRNLYIDFWPKNKSGLNKSEWDNIKYDIVSIVNYLQNKYNFNFHISFSIIDSEKVQNISKDDIIKIGINNLFKFEIVIYLNLKL